MDIQVPKTYNEAMKKPDLWLDPITKKIEILKLQDIFEIVPRLSSKNVVGSKWVFIVKQNEKKKIEKRKARTVAKGYTQVIKEDYNETRIEMLP